MKDQPSASRLLDPAFIQRLEKLELVARKILAGELRGDARARRRGTGTLFRDHKSYAQGDDLRFLDWNAYSRLGELLVKQFESEENLNLFVFLDASGSMDLGEPRKLSFAVELVAALGYIALNRHASVTLARIPRSGGVGTWFGRNQVLPFFKSLAETEARGEADLLEEIKTAVGRRRGRGVAVVVSDFFVEEGYASALRFLQHAGFRLAVIHVLDAVDLHGAVDGRVRLVDVESGRSLKGVVSRAMLDVYEREVRAWCEGVERHCRAHAVDYSRVHTAWTLERAVRELLLRGGLVK